MEFIVKEAACGQLSRDLVANMMEISRLISEIEGQNNTLKDALGEDYDAINSSVKVMKAELTDGLRELKTVVTDMNEYLARVHQVRVVLNK